MDGLGCERSPHGHRSGRALRDRRARIGRTCDRAGHIADDRSRYCAHRLAHGRHPMANKTHCPRQHAYTPENTYMQRGARVCRTCKRARAREFEIRRAFRAAGIAA